MRRPLIALLSLGLGFTSCGAGKGGDGADASAKRGVKLVKIGDFDTPVFVTSPPADSKHRYVVEQAGVIRLVGQDAPFLDIRDRVTVGSEQGLLSMAFAPDYKTSKRFYVYYTNKSSNQQIDEFTATSTGRADAGSGKQVMEMDDPESNHNGGLLLFGRDKHLYVGTGDGGGGGDVHGRLGNGQNLGSPLGKILRIDPKPGGGYDIPSDNPFAGQSGKRGEIYSYGLRNPWRFSFDRKTQDLVIGDVGQNEYEEIDFVKAGKGSGANFGWRPFEGNHVYAEGESAPGAIKPVIERSHIGDGYCSITGGIVVRDKKVPGLYGKYLWGDICKSDIYRAKLSPGKASGAGKSGLQVAQVSSFGEDSAGRVYVVSLDGPVYRLAAK